MKKYLANAALAAFLIGPQVALASDLQFQFNNPSFGGSGLSSTYFLTLLEKQKPDFNDAGAPSTLQAFEDQLERRLLSGIASTITQSIYSDTGADSGSFEIGDLSVTYETIGNEVRIIINDGLSTSEITVPANF